jgi:hypothetical protein
MPFSRSEIERKQNFCMAYIAKLRDKMMRNIILAILTGPVLFGCLNTERPTATMDAGFTAVSVTGNSAPTISGNPAQSTKFGEMYEFQPTANDADGDRLAFDVQNLPDWANFDSSTGRLYGEPSIANVGSYDRIVVSVSDGTSSVSLAAFSIAVNQSALGNVTLSWAAPTQNADGSALTDLAGYRIYYRKNSGSYDNEIQINNPGATSYVVDELSPATYYFAATSYNSSGIESPFSGEIVSVVN